MSPHLDPPTLLLPPRAAGSRMQFPTLPAAPASPAPSIAEELLAQRLRDVLRGAVQGFGARAADLMLLDDATTELRSASTFGDKEALADRTRSLTHAHPDVVAMAGGAIVLEDADMVSEWSVPRPCSAAVCVPVASDATIHGTLWLYFASAQRFEDRQVQLVELIAGRLAVEIERHDMLVRLQSRERSPLR